MDKRVTLTITGPLDSKGQQQFVAEWTSAEMIRAHEECEGSCCVDWRTGLQKAPEDRMHRRKRGQYFFAVLSDHAQTWENAGYIVTLKK